MPRKHDDLFERIADFQPLLAAARRAIRGKRHKAGPAAFIANVETEMLRLERELREGSWRPGRYTVIQVHDPKPRMVSAAPFRDRVVHHALCAVVEPIFEQGFIFDSYANRVGKGTPSAAEPVNLHFPGDDLFAPYQRRRGLPIGNLTSQFFANVYLDGLDHFCKEVLRAPGYVRYVDDLALFHDDTRVLAEWRERIAGYLIGRRLRLHPRKTFGLLATTRG